MRLPSKLERIHQKQCAIVFKYNKGEMSLIPQNQNALQDTRHPKLAFPHIVQCSLRKTRNQIHVSVNL